MEEIKGCKRNKQAKMSMNVHKIVTMGLLAAISIVLVSIIHFPLFPTAAPFLEYDPADIPILIGAIAYGPGAGFVLTLIVSAIQAMTVSAHSGPAGFIMHLAATGAMAIVVGVFYKHSQKKLSSIIKALLLGSITMVIAMVGANLVVTPWFMGVDINIVKSMLVPIIIPFNAIKAVINSVFAFLIGKALERVGVFDKT